MAKCGFCGSSIIMGGVRSGTERYCNNRCATNGQVLKMAQQLPPELVDRQVEEVFRGNCPKCRGPGPVDVHKVHKVWSAFVLTRWTTNAQVSCRACATKSQTGGAFFSALLGWWGFPWGLVLTPVQIGRNIAGMWSGRDSSKPSEDLRRLVMANLGAQAIQRNRQKTP